MRRLREGMRRKRPALWASNDWLIHHDNAPAHTALSVQLFLATNNLAVVPQPPYSPHLAPCNFFLFPKIKMTLKRRRFDDVEEIQRESQAALDAIQNEDFKKCFQKLEIAGIAV
jgi:transposase